MITMLCYISGCDIFKFGFALLARAVRICPIRFFNELIFTLSCFLATVKHHKEDNNKKIIRIIYIFLILLLESLAHLSNFVFYYLRMILLRYKVINLLLILY